VQNEALLQGKRILVLDDVVTTGATLVYCYTALKEISGVQLSISAMAIPVHNRIVV
jgi:hypoxanthine phosphoribosyltransferase